MSVFAHINMFLSSSQLEGHYLGLAPCSREAENSHCDPSLPLIYSAPHRSICLCHLHVPCQLSPATPQVPLASKSCQIVCFLQPFLPSSLHIKTVASYMQSRFFSNSVSDPTSAVTSIWRNSESNIEDSYHALSVCSRIAENQNPRKKLNIKQE